jgi:hypothetical protein
MRRPSGKEIDLTKDIDKDKGQERKGKDEGQR